MRSTGTGDRSIAPRLNESPGEPGIQTTRGSKPQTGLDLDVGSGSEEPDRLHPRKEVIQPQVPLRLPCYDFTPITDHTLDACLPCGLARQLLVQPAFVV